MDFLLKGEIFHKKSFTHTFSIDVPLAVITALSGGFG